jgi:hypothetical protein
VLRAAVSEDTAALRRRTDALIASTAADAWAGAETSSNGSGSDCGGGSPGAPPTPDAPPLPAPPRQWSRCLSDFVALYTEYVRRLRLRAGPDGKVAPLLPGEERFPPDRELMKMYMTMTPSDSLTLLMTNLVGGGLRGVGGRGTVRGM